MNRDQVAIHVGWISTMLWSETIRNARNDRVRTYFCHFTKRLPLCRLHNRPLRKVGSERIVSGMNNLDGYAYKADKQGDADEQETKTVRWHGYQPKLQRYAVKLVE